MRFGLMSDIHANREAYEASIALLRGEGVDQFVILGDIVGYGADPSFCVDQTARLVEDGAIALKGNHDAGALDPASVSMNQYAKAAIDWTARQLDSAQRDFLRDLAMSHRQGEALFVHSDASAPTDWRYVTGAREAEISMGATDARVTICGHVHTPAVYNALPLKPPVPFAPKSNIAIPLLANRKWLAVLGAVGQPRDEIPSASCAVYDDEKKTLTYRRAPYDIESAAAKIHQAGLPQILAARLFIGR